MNEERRPLSHLSERRTWFIQTKLEIHMVALVFCFENHSNDR